MLFHNHAPLYLWLEAFSTTVFLLNQLPSSSLNFETPYFMLHGIHPDYTSLHVFGSKCFLYTWDTQNNKFDPKSALCVFVGYSEKHKGYKCFILLVASLLFLDLTYLLKLFFHLNHLTHLLWFLMCIIFFYSWLSSCVFSESATPLEEPT